MTKWEDMTESQAPYDDKGYQNIRIALIISVLAMCLSVSGLWIGAEYWKWLTIITSLCAFIPTILGFRDKENPYILWCAVVMAIGAIMLQYWMIAIFILFVLAIIVTILSVFGVPLS
ncbi:MAG: hypothetical protein ACRBDI_08345 [Alphaproteobacteria bacterium]